MRSFDHTRRTTTIVVMLLLTSLSAFGQTQQRSSPDESTEVPKTGAITGRVLNESGQPLANAAVSIRAFGSMGEGRGTTTDRDGTFQVGGLDPVAYLISASIPAYTPLPRDPDSTQATYNRVGDSVNLVLIKGGVITGTVTTSTGEPVVGVVVRAQNIRDGNGQPSRYGAILRERTTDDRGVYRIYGLPTGTYLVLAGGSGNFSGSGVNPYDTDAPTYSPSSARDTASEINVRAGEETSSVDIRYRGQPGHMVSGSASGPQADPPSGFSVILTSTFDGGSQWSNSSFQSPGSRGFVFDGVADGDYDVTAQSFFQGGEWTVSEPKRIKVRGADITGIEVTTKPLGSITGRVLLEESKAVECKGKRRPLFTETLISAWHNEKETAKDQPQFLWGLGGPSYPDKQGDISLRNLAPGQYRFIARFFAKYWYLQSISLQSPVTPAAKSAQNRSADAARYWTTLKSGDRLSGLIISLAEGAASLRGQITIGPGEKLPARLFLFLIPAEREKAEDVLRFFAVPVASDGKIILNNLAPGRYLVVAQPALDSALSPLTKLRLPDESETRAKLRRDAEAAKTEIEFKPCQNVTDYQLPLNSSATAPARKALTEP
jgi:hypothetical protein